MCGTTHIVAVRRQMVKVVQSNCHRGGNEGVAGAVKGVEKAGKGLEGLTK